MNRVVHFEIQAGNIERAVKFYKEVFGWKIEKWPGLDFEYWMVMTAEQDSKEAGINGGILKRPVKSPEPKQGTNAYVCTIEVEDFDEIEEKIKAAGGIVAMPKFALAKMAWQGYFLDTEGNTFGIHQRDENAE
jgi:predicted enzyme related to lactoylglutathione lyase